MSNESGGLERDPSVSELQATVDALRQDLAEATARIRELEEQTDGVTPGGSGSDADRTTEASETATGAVDPGTFDALAEGAIDTDDDVTVGDLDVGEEGSDGSVDDTAGMPGRDPTQHPQNTQDAELVDAGSASGSASESERDSSTTATTDVTESVSDETTTEAEEEDDDSDDIIVA